MKRLKDHLCRGSVLAISCLLLAAGGCGNKADLAGREIAPTKPPPGFPAPRDMPMSAELVSSARKELETLRNSPKAGDRSRAIEGLKDLHDPAAERMIVSGLEDASPMVRCAAAMAIGDLKLASAKPNLNEKLNDPDARVCVSVRYALHKLGDYSHSRDLQQYALYPDPKVRGQTALVLGRLGESSASGILRTMRADVTKDSSDKQAAAQHAAVRHQAEEALFLLGDDRGRDAIIGYLNSYFVDDVMLGLSALAANKDSRYREHARGLLSKDDLESREVIALAAARAMGAMDADDGYGVAMAGVTSKQPLERQLAASAFGMIGRTDAQPYLQTLLNDSDADVRAAAADAIVRIAAAPKLYTRQGDLVRR